MPKDSCSSASVSSGARSFFGIELRIPVGTTRGWRPRKGTSKLIRPRI
jgi:hypothetical protein